MLFGIRDSHRVCINNSIASYENDCGSEDLDLTSKTW